MQDLLLATARAEQSKTVDPALVAEARAKLKLLATKVLEATMRKRKLHDLVEAVRLHTRDQGGVNVACTKTSTQLCGEHFPINP